MSLAAHYHLLRTRVTCDSASINFCRGQQLILSAQSHQFQCVNIQVSVKHLDTTNYSYTILTRPTTRFIHFVYSNTILAGSYLDVKPVCLLAHKHTELHLSFTFRKWADWHFICIACSHSRETESVYQSEWQFMTLMTIPIIIQDGSRMALNPPTLKAPEQELPH